MKNQNLTRLSEEWPRKALAILVAIIIWTLVNQSITTTKTTVSIALHHGIMYTGANAREAGATVVCREA